MKLWIAEKPSVAMEIAGVLGKPQRGDGFVSVGDDTVTWCVGHLIRQADPTAYDPAYEKWSIDHLPIIPEEWKMEPGEKTRGQLKIVGQLLKKATSVVNCGDSAREGQLIVDELLDYFKFKGKSQRLWLREMNPAAIRKAMAAMAPNESKRTLYESALARSRADWVMGMNLTRGFSIAWQSKGNGGALHIGRVQTPTLCMIVQRDLDIEAFVPVDFYTLKVTFRHEKGEFSASWIPSPDADFLDASGHVLDKKIPAAIAEKIAGKLGKITSYTATPKEAPPPLPFSLGELQKTANKMLGLSPTQTLDVAQALYEKHKLTTYPRTDYAHLPEDEHKLSPGIIKAVRSNFGSAWDFPGEPDFAIRSAAWNSSKIGDHHGLRPTDVTGKNLGDLKPMEMAVYRLIVRNFLAQFYPKHAYVSITANVSCEGEAFKAQGQTDTNLGWRVLFPSGKEEEKAASIPQMSSGDQVKTVSANVKTEKTSPPPRFDGALIIDAMERAHLYVSDARIKAKLSETGIGTPATRARIVESLLERNYINEVKQGRKKVYISTAKGRALFNAVPEQLRKPDLTAYFEEMLKAVERGEVTLDAFMEQQRKYVVKLIDDVRSGVVAAGMVKIEDARPATSGGRGKGRSTKGRAPAKPAASSALPI